MGSFSMFFFLFLLFAGAGLAQPEWQIGGTIGYGAYRNGSIYAPDGKVTLVAQTNDGEATRLLSGPAGMLVATGDAEFVEDSFRAAVAAPAPAVTLLHRLYLSRAVKAVVLVGRAGGPAARLAHGFARSRGAARCDFDRPRQTQRAVEFRLAAGERRGLDVLHGLVAEVADQPPAEAQRRRHRRDARSAGRQVPVCRKRLAAASRRPAPTAPIRRSGAPAAP